MQYKNCPGEGDTVHLNWRSRSVSSHKIITSSTILIFEYRFIFDILPLTNSSKLSQHDIEDVKLRADS